MNEDVQMNKTGKFASYLKTVQTAGKKIRANIFIRILNPRKVKWGKKCEPFKFEDFEKDQIKVHEENKSKFTFCMQCDDTITNKEVLFRTSACKISVRWCLFTCPLQNVNAV